jgi:hypothetical protein
MIFRLKSEYKKPLRPLKHKWEYNIKMSLQGIYELFHNHLQLIRDQWLTFKHGNETVRVT